MQFLWYNSEKRIFENMKRCPKCKTIYIDDSTVCRYCSAPLVNIDEPKNTNSGGNKIVSVIIYTFIFILFIMGLYFLASALISR